MRESRTTSSESPNSDLIVQAKDRPLVTLDEIGLPTQQASEDDLFLEEKRDYDSERQDIEIRTLTEDVEHRKAYSQSIFNLMRVWLVSVLGTVVFDSAGWIDVSEGVLIALISGTTASVIGLFAIVARYFFPKR